MFHLGKNDPTGLAGPFPAFRWKYEAQVEHLAPEPWNLHNSANKPSRRPEWWPNDGAKRFSALFKYMNTTIRWLLLTFLHLRNSVSVISKCSIKCLFWENPPTFHPFSFPTFSPTPLPRLRFLLIPLQTIFDRTRYIKITVNFTDFTALYFNIANVLIISRLTEVDKSEKKANTSRQLIVFACSEKTEWFCRSTMMLERHDRTTFAGFAKFAFEGQIIAIPCLSVPV